jgi:predicted O-methyltransferase YrrM
MPSLQKSVMQKLYGRNIWDDFIPKFPSQQVQGWNGNHPSLARLATLPAPHAVVDVGVWKGQSTITMARAIKEAGIDSCVIAVDTFLGSTEHWEAGKELFGRSHGFPDLYDLFLSNVYHAGVADYIVPVPQTSVAAAKILKRANIMASVVHVDAAHEYHEVLRDLDEYWAIIAPGGYLIGDDYGECWPGVVRAVGEFSAKVGRALAVESPKWILKKR